MSDSHQRIRADIEKWREPLEADLGAFTLEDNEETGEVIMHVTDPDADDLIHRFRCYIVDGKLIYDDYFPPAE